MTMHDFMSQLKLKQQIKMTRLLKDYVNERSH